MLFYLMLSCGIPELEKESDILWLRKHLMVWGMVPSQGVLWECSRARLGCEQLDATDEEAAEHFRGCIREALGSTRTNLMHAVHLLRHA